MTVFDWYMAVMWLIGICITTFFCRDVFVWGKVGTAKNPNTGVSGAAAPAGAGGGGFGIGRGDRLDLNGLDGNEEGPANVGVKGDREGPGDHGLEKSDNNEEDPTNIGFVGDRDGPCKVGLDGLDVEIYGQR